jgi:hypothetical protein
MVGLRLEISNWGARDLSPQLIEKMAMFEDEGIDDVG